MALADIFTRTEGSTPARPASTRAYGLLTRYGILSGTEAGGTRRVLTAAAFTYIAAALTAVLTFLYLLAVSRQ